MGRYSRTAEERAQLDEVVLNAIRDGWGTPDELRDVVRERLIRTGHPWAKALARSTNFPTTLRSVITRLKTAGKIVVDKRSVASRWSLAS